MPLYDNHILYVGENSEYEGILILWLCYNTQVKKFLRNYDP